MIILTNNLSAVYFPRSSISNMKCWEICEKWPEIVQTARRDENTEISNFLIR